MPRAPTMNDMRSRLEAIRREIEKLRTQESILKAQESLLLDMMDEKPAATTVRAAKGSVKSTVLDLLERAGEGGLNAAIAVEMAKEDGIDLDRGSVSSLLSRLKTDNVVIYNGTVYRLKKFSQFSGGVTRLRTSGDVFG